MEIRTNQSFNAIPVILIRVVFNLYLSSLLCKLYFNYFIYLFIYLFIYIFIYVLMLLFL